VFRFYFSVEVDSDLQPAVRSLYLPSLASFAPAPASYTSSLHRPLPHPSPADNLTHPCLSCIIHSHLIHLPLIIAIPYHTSCTLAHINPPTIFHLSYLSRPSACLSLAASLSYRYRIQYSASFRISLFPLVPRPSLYLSLIVAYSYTFSSRPHPYLAFPSTSIPPSIVYQSDPAVSAVSYLSLLVPSPNLLRVGNCD
jgi:hypothetical protein